MKVGGEKSIKCTKIKITKKKKKFKHIKTQKITISSYYF